MLWISQAYMCICMLILCAQSVPGKLYSTIILVSWPCFDSFQPTQMPKYQNINLFDEWNCCLHTCVYVTLHRWLTTPNIHCMRYFTLKIASYGIYFHKVYFCITNKTLCERIIDIIQLIYHVIKYNQDRYLCFLSIWCCSPRLDVVEYQQSEWQTSFLFWPQKTKPGDYEGFF